MITAYASIVPQATFPGSVVLTIAARDDAAPLVQGQAILFTIQLKTMGQTWTTPGLYPNSFLISTNAEHIAHTALSLPLSVASFDARVKAQVHSGGAISDWVEVPYRAPAVDALMPPRSRFITYKSVLDGFLRRSGHGAANAATDDDLSDAAEMITSAYRYCLETCNIDEAKITRTLTIANGFVPWPMIFGADWYEFWTEDPDAENSQAVPIHVERKDARGLRLETTLTRIYAKFTPRAPEFRADPVVPATRYGLGDIVYHEDSGNMYEVVNVDGALGSDIADRAQWRCLQLLWLLADTTKLLALADVQGNSKEERAQAADLRSQVEQRLDQISQRIN